LTKQTASLNLSKPEITDKIVDTITQLASNFDVIDSSLADERVNIFNIQGIGINQVQNFDCTLSHITMMYVGTASNPALTYYQGTTDLTNAVHAFGLRIENCPVMLKISGNGTNKPPRQNQFVACKFEWGTDFTKISAGIIIEEGSQNAFVGCGFVTQQSDFPLISVSVPGTGADERGLKFTGCDWISNGSNIGWALDVASRVTDVDVIGCTFTGMLQSITGNSLNIVGCSFMDCVSPVINVVKANVSNNVFKSISGTDYTVYLSDQSRYIGNRIEGKTNTTKGINVHLDCYIAGNHFETLAEGIYFASSGNTARNNKMISVTTPYANPTMTDFNFIEDGYSSAISPISTGKKYQVTYDGGSNLKVHNGTQWFNAQIIQSGATAGRPTGKPAGYSFYDTTLNKPVFYDGTSWRDATGTVV
jgi:hypothetical protein